MEDGSFRYRLEGIAPPQDRKFDENDFTFNQINGSFKDFYLIGDSLDYLKLSRCRLLRSMDWLSNEWCVRRRFILEEWSTAIYNSKRTDQRFKILSLLNTQVLETLNSLLTMCRLHLIWIGRRLIPKI